MLTIKGKVTEIKRVMSKAPEDGVHRVSTKTGYMKGVRCFMLNGALMPKGQTAFYHQHRTNAGLKVFYKVDNEGCHRSSLKAVKKEWKKRMRLAPYKVMPTSIKIVKVNLDLKYQKKRINTWAYAIKVAHVDYPKKAWENFAKGIPYDWDCLDQREHPDHNPEGVKRFYKKITRALKATGVTVCGDYPVKEKKPPKLGDVVYSVSKKRWYLVDAG